jgi:hypothetical protein
MSTPVRTAKVIQVVYTEALRGTGRDGDPYRCVKGYRSLDGRLLAEVDELTKEAEG